MALLDVGIPAEALRIDAVDMSRSALRHARAGIYGENSFRGGDLTFRDRYFEPIEEGHRLRPDLVRAVNFVRINIAAETLLDGEEPYDAVFCRNLLIYFDERTRDRLFSHLARLIKPDGLLFLGASETSQVPTRHFAPVKQVKSFAFRRADSPQPAGGRGRRPIASRHHWPMTGQKRLSASDAVPSGAVAVANPDYLPVDPRSPQNGRPAEAPLDRAQRLADEGDLETAADLCRGYLRQDQGNARAYYLLGLISQATGKLEEAEEWLDKTIYLDPKHREALVYRSLIAADRGDHEVAKRLMERAEKCA